MCHWLYLYGGRLDLLVSSTWSELWKLMSIWPKGLVFLSTHVSSIKHKRKKTTQMYKLWYHIWKFLTTVPESFLDGSLEQWHFLQMCILRNITLCYRVDFLINLLLYIRVSWQLIKHPLHCVWSLKTFRRGKWNWGSVALSNRGHWLAPASAADWFNKGCVMCYHVNVIMHVKAI